MIDSLFDLENLVWGYSIVVYSFYIKMSLEWSGLQGAFEIFP